MLDVNQRIRKKYNNFVVNIGKQFVYMKLFAYICNRLKPNNITKQNITKMKTKIFTLLLNKSLLSKLALIALLLTGGGNCAWGEDVKIFDGSDGKVTDGWSYTNNAGTSMSVTSSSLNYYSSSESRFYTSTGTFNITTGWAIAINAKLYGTNTPCPAFIKVKYSDDNGESWKVIKEYNEEDLTLDYNNLPVIDNFTGNYKIQFEFRYVYISSIYLLNPDSKPSPSNLTTTGVTGNSATFSWSLGKNESEWEIAYSTDPGFTPGGNGMLVNVTSNPTTISNLVDGVTYYAAIRSVYDGGKSDWTEKVSFVTGTNETLNSDASNTTANVPIPNYTANNDYLTKSQIIIPNSELKDFEDKYITQVVFYATSSTIDWGTATYDVYLAETETSSFAYSAVFIDWTNCIKVISDTKLKVVGGMLVLDLETPYLYTGTDNKNLLIGFAQKTTSTSTVSSSWSVKSKTPGSGKYYAAAYYNSGSFTYSTGQSYVPKMTIKAISSTLPVTLGANGFTTFACPRALDFTAANMPEGLKAYKATVDGTNVRFTEIDQTVPANTGVLLEGTGDETYQIPVAESGTALEGNDFLVNSTGGTFAAESGYTYYALKKNSNPLTFATFNPTTLQLPTNKAYLKVADTAARSLTCWFDNETTGISSMSNEQSAFNSSTSTGIYNLQGQRVSQPQKGIYIVNGKKFINK